MANYQNFQPGEALAGQIASANDFAVNAPDLISGAPGLATDALQSSDPGNAGTTLSTASQIDAAQSALQDVQTAKTSTWWQTALGDVMKSPVGTALNYLNKPLQSISDDYKFVHAVWTQNGPLQGLIATLGIAGGAAAGAVVGDPFLGAAAAGELEKRLIGAHLGIDRKAYALSQNPNYNVSFGRDLANFMGAHGDTNNGWGQYVSGAGDALFNMVMDPVALASKATSAARAGTPIKNITDTLQPAIGEDGKALLDANGEAILRTTGETTSTAAGGVKGLFSSGYRSVPLAAHWEGLDQFLQARSIRFTSPDQVDAVFNGGVGTLGPAYRSALRDIGSMTQAQVQLRYPMLARMTSLVAGKTPEEVNDVIKRATYEKDLINLVNGPNVLPARTVLRQGTDAVASWMKNSNLPVADASTPEAAAASLDTQRKAYSETVGNQTVFGDKIPLPVKLQNLFGGGRMTRTFTGMLPFHVDADMAKLTNNEIDVTNDAHGLDLYRQMRYSMPDIAAKDMLNTFLQTPSTDIAARKALVAAIHMETLKAAGLPDDAPLVLSVKDQLSKLANGSGNAGKYGFGYHDGEGVNTFETDRGTINAGLYTFQADPKMSLLNLRDVLSATRDLHTVSSVYGKIDDTMANAYTNLIFKPLALLRPAFSLRVAMGEQIQAMIRHGAGNMIAAKVASTAIKAGVKYNPDQVLQTSHEAVLAARDMGEYPAAHENAPAIRVLQNEADPVNWPSQLDKSGVVKRPMSVLRRIYGPALYKMARTVNPENVDIAAWARVHFGEVLPGAVSMGHGGYDSDLWERANGLMWAGSQKDARSVGRKWEDGMTPDSANGATHTSWAPDDQQFLSAWHLNLHQKSQNVMAQNVTQDALNRLRAGASQDEAWKYAEDRLSAHLAGFHHDPAMPGGIGTRPLAEDDPYAAERNLMVRSPLQTSAGYAHAVADDMRNTYSGVDGTFHDDLARMVARGQKPSLQRMDAVDPNSYPRGVNGRRDIPYIGKNLYNRIVTNGYSKVLGPIVDSLSREPLFITQMKKEMQGLDYAVQAGHMTKDEAYWTAAQRATFGMLPQIHNPLLRSQFAVAANNYLPFYFAQEQSYKRFGRLMLSNPEMIRRYQMIYAGLNNSSFIQTDANGGKHVMIPGMGPVGQAFMGAAAVLGMPLMAGLPVSASGAVSSLQSVLPETNLPGVSPLLGLAAKYIGEHNPMLNNIVNHVDPYASNSDLQSIFIPSSPVRDLLTGLTGDEKNLAFHNAEIAAYRAAYYHGDLQGYATMTPQQQQQVQDRIRNNARSMFMFKAILGTLSPLAPSISQEDPGLRQEFLSMVDAAYKKGPSVVNPDGSRESSYTAVIDKFLAEHGTNAISYTVASTIPTDPGYIPLNTPAIQWIEKNLQHVTDSSLGTAASFLVPQTSAGGDTQVIQDELLKDNLRSRDTPGQFLDAVYTAAGNNYISPAQKQHDANVTAMQGDSLGLSQEYNNWQSYVQLLSQQNPIWGSHYNDKAKQQQVAISAIAGLNTLLRDPNTWVDKSEPQVQLVTAMLNDWQNHEAQRTYLTGRAATSEAHTWQAYLRQRELDTPALAPIIRTVFLPLGSS